MKLATRLSLFFLVALAVVLVGFSVALYLLARTYLYRQVDEQLTTAVHTLIAAAELKPDGVEWELRERRLTLGQDSAVGQVRWMVHDGEGNLVDRSRNLGDESLFEPSAAVAVSESLILQKADRQGGSWRMGQQWLRSQAGDFSHAQTTVVLRDADQFSKAVRAEDHRYPALLMTAAVSLQPLQSVLWTLAVTLTGLSAGIWLIAALAGRWLCRRALVPLTRMAEAAHSMRATDLGQRLPSPQTRDELEELGVAFNALLSRVEEAFERQRRFTGDASHQLRTPLTAVLGQVEVALHRERSGEEYRKTLGLVHRQANNLRQIVESLLFLSRANAEANLPDLDQVDLAAWLTEYVQGWSGHLRRPDIRLEGVSDGPIWVQVHASLLSQLVGNLFDNACKYSEPGTPIVVQLGRESTIVMLAVEDAGCGITADELAYIFEPFYRSAHARRQGRGGTGLGLAVAQRIAVAFGGFIHAESQPGHGSRFTLRLPASIDSATVEKLPAESTADSAETAKEMARTQ